jgi:hypothetical protein
MAEPKVPIFKVGDRVRVRNTPGLVARVVEVRGPLGPKGVQVYGIRVGRTRPRPYVEVREDQLEILLPKV